MNTGFSPNAHPAKGGNVLASPAVEMLAAMGLQHARPAESKTIKRQISYGAWHTALPLSLARATLGGGMRFIPGSRFRFQLVMSGKNKVVTFAQQEDADE